MARLIKFVIMNPDKMTAEVVQCENLHVAEQLAGLGTNEVDHGLIMNLADGTSVHCVTSEFGLYTLSQFVGLNRIMLAGNVVLYRAGLVGDTIDMTYLPPPLWLPTPAVAEQAILAGAVERPRFIVNGKVYWTWPEKIDYKAMIQRAVKEAL